MPVEQAGKRSHVGTDIQHAAQLLNAGELVAIPTETVYGLAGNALNPLAVAKIFEVKARPHFDPLIVHVHSRESLAEFATEVPNWAARLVGVFWPGPLTIVLPKKALIPDIVTAGRNTVALRMPNHPLALELLEALPFPLAAPSANPFGYISPTTAQHVVDQLSTQIEYVLDGGPCKIGIESTIVGEQDGKPVIFRQGGTSAESIAEVIGRIETVVNSESQTTAGALAPGMLSSHYAPRTPFILDEPDSENSNLPKIGVLRFTKIIEGVPRSQQRILSASSDLREAAANLFAAMRELDAMHLDAIYAELVPNVGLGRAINDRLQRASVRGIYL
jgi:L-threonylcarbamoyladenylate synthase